jgi:hypothetical protein
MLPQKLKVPSVASVQDCYRKMNASAGDDFWRFMPAAFRASIFLRLSLAVHWYLSM